MEPIGIILLVFGFSGILFCFFMMCRNKWVSDERGKIIKNVAIESKKYIDDCYNSGNGSECNVIEFHELNYEKKYWSYDRMMSNFWIWDVEKMTNYH